MSQRLVWFCFLIASVTCSLPSADHNVLSNIRAFAADYKEYYASGTMNGRFQQTVEMLRLRTPWKGANPKFDPLIFDIISPEEKEPVNFTADSSLK
jgi:hypothetical protein